MQAVVVTGEEGRKIDEERGVGREMRVFLVSIKQLCRLRLSIPKLQTVYFVQSGVALCEITSA